MKRLILFTMLLGSSFILFSEDNDKLEGEKINAEEQKIGLSVNGIEESLFSRKILKRERPMENFYFMLKSECYIKISI